LILDVPLDPQEKPNTCWHSAAYMIWLYWQRRTGKQGPMWTVPKLYDENRAITPPEFIRLARNVGLREVACLKQYASDDLKKMLDAHGPIWCAGWWYGPGHVIVLTGVNGDTAHINDPDGGVKKQIPVAWFNTKLANQYPGCLMEKNPGAY
jgi:ABC-type bacteriocin/lantibiotic exporter with double-glycine peptidase domain